MLQMIQRCLFAIPFRNFNRKNKYFRTEAFSDESCLGFSQILGCCCYVNGDSLKPATEQWNRCRYWSVAWLQRKRCSDAQPEGRLKRKLKTLRCTIFSISATFCNIFSFYSQLTDLFLFQFIVISKISEKADDGDVSRSSPILPAAINQLHTS